MEILPARAMEDAISTPAIRVDLASPHRRPETSRSRIH